MAVGDLTFAFNPDTDTPETVEKRRRLAQAILSSGRAPSNVGEGLYALSNGILAAILGGQADKAEAAGRAGANEAWGAAFNFPAAPAAASDLGATTALPNKAIPAAADASLGSSIDFARAAPASLPGGTTEGEFMNTIAGKVKNPYALAAIASTGKAESGWSPKNAAGTWADPSQSGVPGRAGGIMSWRDGRLDALQAFAGGDLSPAKQAEFFLQEDPALLDALAKTASVEEAQRLMNNAWRFAGYDQAGGAEVGERLASAQAYLPQFQQSGTPVMPAAIDPRNFIRYANQEAVREMPLDPKLVEAMSFLPELGITMEVFSGGQHTAEEVAEAAARGETLDRTGSVRHDHGGAGDVFFYKDGRKLDWANAADVPLYQDIVRRAKARGVTGFGAGPGYMQPGSMHLGFGKPAVWGAGGEGVNAPGWLTEAYNGGGAPVQVASLDPNAGMPAIAPAAAPAAGGIPAPTGPQPANVRLAQALTDRGGAPEMAGNWTPEAGGQLGMQQLMDLSGDPWLSEAQQRLLQALMERQMQQADPAYQMGLRKAQLELQALENPQMSPSERANYELNVQKFGAEEAQRMFERDQAAKQFTLDTDKFKSEDADRTADNTRADQELDIRKLEYLLRTVPDFYTEYARQEQAAGRTPLGIMEYALQFEKAGASNTNVNVGGNNSKFIDEADKLAADRLGKIVEGGQGAASFLGDIQQLRDLGTLFNTGKEAEVKAMLGPWAEYVGIDIAGLGEMQAFDAIAARLAPQMRPAGSGAASDFDARQFLKSLPSLGNTPEGNAILTSTFAALQEHKLKAAEIAGRAFAAAGDPNGITWQEAERLIRALPNPYEGFNQWRKKAIVEIDGYTIEPVSP